MSSQPRTRARTLGLTGLATGLATAAALGLARRRRTRTGQQETQERFGSLSGKQRTVTTGDGVQLAVDVEAGDGDIAIVFAHGWTLNRHVWHYQRQALAGWPMVFYDHRGHGGSAAVGCDDCTIDHLGEDLAEVIAAAVPPEKKVVLVGHSMGGMTIMALAGKHPELFGDRIAGVAMLSTSCGNLAQTTFGLPGVIGRSAPIVTPRLFDLLLARKALVEATPRIRYRATLPFTRLAFGADPKRRHIKLVNEMTCGTPVEVLVGFFRSMEEHDKLAALSALNSVETLIVAGELDKLTPVSHARVIAQAVPGALLRVLPLAGHMVGLERPDAVNRALADFLDRVRTA